MSLNVYYSELDKRWNASNYSPLPVVLESGHGIYVWDVEGKSYIDCLAGYSALNFGHSHPVLIKAAKEQLDTLNLTSRAFYTRSLAEFSEFACKFFDAKKILPMNSGAEGVETALKVARKWGMLKKKVTDGKQEVVVFDRNFHGRTISVISFSSNLNYKQGFGPLTPGFMSIPYNDLATLDMALSSIPTIVAVLVEPVQGEGGMHVPDDDFLPALRRLCNKYNVLMIDDEIQTGLGRCGADLAVHRWNVTPDLVILGKALGGGIIPISAVMDMRGDIMDVLSPGDHGSTFGGNPLACAIAKASIGLLQEEDLSHKAWVLGDYFRSKVRAFNSPLIKEVRGLGLMNGIELNKPALPYCLELMKEGILCFYTKTNILRVTPPLIIAKYDLNKVLDILEKVLTRS